ncbi:hypothetical protein D4R71_00435 [bacterium]|nr:MAG: hypothetical protein D4R71_00435 [bacterium]
MIRQLHSFSNRLTNYYPRKELDSVIAQLRKYGAKEGKDFVIKEKEDFFAVYINYEAYQPDIVARRKVIAEKS